MVIMVKKRIPGEIEVARPRDVETRRLSALRPYVRQAGNSWREPWLLKERKLLDYLLVYVPAGRGVFSIDGVSSEVSDGTLYWVPPDTLAEMRGTSRQMHCMYLHFDLLYDPERSHWDASIPGGVRDLSDFKTLMHPPINDPDISSWRGSIEVSNHVAIQDLIEEICIVHKRARDSSMLKLSGLMTELVDAILHGEREMGFAGARANKVMREAAAYIYEHVSENLDVGKLAGKFNLSAPHFRKLFRETHRISPSVMHRRSRIRKACEVLAFGSHNVSETAEMLGFSCIHSFSRAFKDVTGVSPVSYRNGGNLFLGLKK